MNRREFFQTTAFAAAMQKTSAQTQSRRERRWIEIAESLKPRLSESVRRPVAMVRPEPDPSRFLRWRMEQIGPASQLPSLRFRKGGSFILDFGEHLVGYLDFSLSGEGECVDAPVRLRITFGEAPADVATPFETYSGALAIAWLPDEVINVDWLPQRVRMSRRQAFRYVKVDVIDTSPNFAARFDRVEAVAVTSAGAPPQPLPSHVPAIFRRIDQVSLATLRDCMQTVFEDGPRRDRRLWVGDLKLQAITNYLTFKNYDLVKRCLYLFAGLPREDGLVAACVYEHPEPLCGRQFIMDYSVLFGPTVLDYVKATGDRQTARELWPVVRRQLEIVGKFVGRDGLFHDPGGWWIFVDWRDELDRTAPMHAILLFGYKQAIELARLAGAEKDTAGYTEQIEAMTQAARAAWLDPQTKLFVSGPQKQVSWATQAWMVIAGAATAEEGATAFRTLQARKDAVRPGTPYLYHYVVDAMLQCGMKQEATDLIRSYWGGMVEAGADTFWEVYDPSDPLLSPYKSVLVNSYCHAWSCTPSYFLRGRGLF